MTHHRPLILTSIHFRTLRSHYEQRGSTHRRKCLLLSGNPRSMIDTQYVCLLCKSVRQHMVPRMHRRVRQEGRRERNVQEFNPASQYGVLCPLAGCFRCQGVQFGVLCESNTSLDVEALYRRVLPLCGVFRPSRAFHLGGSFGDYRRRLRDNISTHGVCSPVPEACYFC